MARPRFTSFGILALVLVYVGMLTFSPQLVWAGVAIALTAIIARLIAAFR